MQTIHKYAIAVATEQKIMLPAGGKILCVQTQYGKPYIWCKIDTDAPYEEVTLFTFDTGHNCDGTANYIGTYQLHEGDLVYHVFEAKNE